MKIEFSRQILEKYWSTKSYENPSNGSELFHADGHSDRHDVVNSRFSQVFEHA